MTNKAVSLSEFKHVVKTWIGPILHFGEQSVWYNMPLLKTIVHPNTTFLHMKFNKICSLNHPVY